MDDAQWIAGPELDERIRLNTNLSAALGVLEDGKPREADVLLRDGIASGAFPDTMSAKSIYLNLVQYIDREVAHQRRPEVVYDSSTHTFRVNRPVDDWPEIRLEPRPRNVSAEQLDAISNRLRSTSTGDDTAAFEQAVCEAFTLMGFIAKHIGGTGAPDGTLDAPLGPLGYRAILECKTARLGVAKTVLPSEPAKFRDVYGATAAVIVGPDFKQEAMFFSELEAHDVALWVVDDLIDALRYDIDAYECIELFKGGVVHDRMREMIWNRTHGPEKRAAVVRMILRREGYATQRDLAGQVPWTESPGLTLEVAMVLVEGALRKMGASGGATRDEIRAAMDDLVRSFDAVALPENRGIVIRNAGRSS
jgi:hypothetical protein